MSAIFSPCQTWRYRLGRDIDMFGGPTIGFCLHNASTADEEKNDPTTTRGIGFATAWGGSRLVYVNPWAGCAKKPAKLWAMPDPVGPDNDPHIIVAAAECAASGGFMVAAWGVVSPPAPLRAAAAARLKHVEALIRDTGCDLRALGVNADGSPKHPLYVRATALPLQWPRAGRAAA